MNNIRNSLLFPSVVFEFILNFLEQCDSKKTVVLILEYHLGGAGHNHVCQLFIVCPPVIYTLPDKD